MGAVLSRRLPQRCKLVSFVLELELINQWVPSTLKRTIEQCGGAGKGPGEDLKQCAPLAPTVSQQTSWDCRYEGKIPNEYVLP